VPSCAWSRCAVHAYLAAHDHLALGFRPTTATSTSSPCSALVFHTHTPAKSHRKSPNNTHNLPPPSINQTQDTNHLSYRNLGVNPMACRQSSRLLLATWLATSAPSSSTCTFGALNIPHSLAAIQSGQHHHSADSSIGQWVSRGEQEESSGGCNGIGGDGGGG